MFSDCTEARQIDSDLAIFNAKSISLQLYHYHRRANLQTLFHSLVNCHIPNLLQLNITNSPNSHIFPPTQRLYPHPPPHPTR